ncbi:hypothetical protein M8J75_003285 [Diaphorina citri]|nr:hypothetical protein M8J75_003285 [Diaphorina citri]KAI5728469.1 hypothetical protein M8J77_016623 [Diaphorina citri]
MKKTPLYDFGIKPLLKKTPLYDFGIKPLLKKTPLYDFGIKPLLKKTPLCTLDPTRPRGLRNPKTGLARMASPDPRGRIQNDAKRDSGAACNCRQKQKKDLEVKLADCRSYLNHNNNEPNKKSHYSRKSRLNRGTSTPSIHNLVKS